MEQFMTLSNEQKLTLEKAIELLTPFAQKERDQLSCNTVYFKVNDEDVSSEYDTCDNLKCIQKSKKEIRKSYGKGTHIEECWTDNDGDHENIERCSICFRPLSDSLTWINSELEHHEEYSIELSCFKEGHSAFDVMVMLDAMPSCDCRITEYDLHQNKIGNPGPLIEAEKRRNDFINRVIRYAELIINLLSSSK